MTPATLQPRPETETMLVVLASLNIPAAASVADIGTGSGAIAITAKLEMPHIHMHATDIQSDALKIAKKNALKHGADIKFYMGNLLDPLISTQIHTIVANLPYVPNSHTINQAAMQEPAVAIFGGEDGLDLYRTLFTQTISMDKRPEFILAESLPFQHAVLTKIATETGYVCDKTSDFIQLFRLS